MADSRKKRFPADTSLQHETFLNNKKINGELYGLLQAVSEYTVVDKKWNIYQTFVTKKNMPTQGELCKHLGIKSPKTIREHLRQMMDKSYIIPGEGDIVYYLPEVEDIYFLIPIETLRYLIDSCKPHVVKLYIYLGQRYALGLKIGQNYEFTMKQLGAHLGIGIENHSRVYEVVNNALLLLQNSGLIDYVEYYDGVTQKKKLTHFSLEVKNPNG